MHLIIVSCLIENSNAMQQSLISTVYRFTETSLLTEALSQCNILLLREREDFFPSTYFIASQEEEEDLNVSLQADSSQQVHWCSSRQMEGQEDVKSKRVEERKDL